MFFACGSEIRMEGQSLDPSAEAITHCLQGKLSKEHIRGTEPDQRTQLKQILRSCFHGKLL